MNLSNEDKEFLNLYSDSIYEKPSVTVDACVFRIADKESENYRKLSSKKLQIYVVKRNNSPFINQYAIVGTFIDLNFELSQSMLKCLKNKIEMEDDCYYEQLYTFGNKARDPRTRVLSVSYLFLTNENQKLKNGEWFDVDLKVDDVKTIGNKTSQKVEIILSNENETLKSSLVVNRTKNKAQVDIDIKNSDLAFDHAKIIYYAISRLRNKLEYTDIGFNLLPKTFTLTELKQVYEEILGEKLLDANFRRKISKLVVSTNQFKTGKGHRNSELFKHNPNWHDSHLE